MDNPKSIRRFRILLVATVAVFVCFFYFGWIWFHSIPSEVDLRRALEAADDIEIVEFTEGKFTKWLKTDDRTIILSISESLHFKEHYWHFGPKPANALMVQTFRGKNRTSVWDVREDGAIYVRKAVRWYRMPVEAGLREEIRRRLDEKGEPVPKDYPQPPPEDL